MTKVVKFTGFGVVLVLTLLASALGEQVYLDRSLYRQTSEALNQLHDLSVQLSLQASVPAEHASGFKQMVKTQAVFKTKLREYGEMKTDLGESLKKSGLYLDSLSLSDDSHIPEFSSDDLVPIGPELNADESYEPTPKETFATQSWLAKIHAKKNVSSVFQSWLEKNKGSGNVAIIADNVTIENGSLLLRFRSGMIPTMKMPKRVLKIDHITLPVRAEARINVLAPDFLHYRARAHVLAEKFNKMKAKILADEGKILENLEKADKAKWLWMASLKSREFIEQSKAASPQMQ